LIGDRQPQINALFTINPQVAEGIAGKAMPPEEMAESEAVQKEVHRLIQKVNKQLAPFEQIRKFRILPRDFSIESGEMTATMKVRRTKVLANFKDVVDSLYAGA
jgi:long-chain acyl-CoA synthetase